MFLQLLILRALSVAVIYDGQSLMGGLWTGKHIANQPAQVSLCCVRSVDC